MLVWTVNMRAEENSVNEDIVDAGKRELDLPWVGDRQPDESGE